jgi:hypothetical protein
MLTATENYLPGAARGAVFGCGLAAGASGHLSTFARGTQLRF